jgi:hypothetical protein
MNYNEIYTRSRELELSGRYITNDHISLLLQKANRSLQTFVAGYSVQSKPIYGYRTGIGKIRILAWSQMHGNESTATKALFDLFNFFDSKSSDSQRLLAECTFCFVPILNPDGAEMYTRENANEIDLNRDAQNLSQPESRVLRKLFHDFDPDYCFNLHDQRTIFEVGFTGRPATISFLAPSYNETCEFNPVRDRAVHLIAAMNAQLQRYIPGCVGRFDDAFNLNCVGDTFQHDGRSTILVEAGHYPNDWSRDISRKFVFIALLSGFKAAYENVIVGNEFEHYMRIPQNNPNFFDFVYKNVSINYDKSEIITNFAAQYTEQLVGNHIDFFAYIVKIGDLSTYNGHCVFDAKGRKFSDGGQSIPREGQAATFLLGDDIRILNGVIAGD